MDNLSETQQKEVEEMVKKETIDGRITCGRAREIAKTLGVPIKSVGKTADLLNIRISKCQLGCF